MKICAGFCLIRKAREHRGTEHTQVCEYRRMRAATQRSGQKTSKRSSEEEHRADALALGADEGRDKLR